MMRKFKGLDCILLVDDDAATNFINTLVIKNAGIDATLEVRETAMAALEFLSSGETGTPGLILLDINMPVMSGWDFMEEYEQLPPDQKARFIVVMLSSSMNEDDIEKAEKHEDIAAFLHKPLEEKDITGIIEKLFEPA
jgi:CheY-like chemotaxis protein